MIPKKYQRVFFLTFIYFCSFNMFVSNVFAAKNNQTCVITNKNFNCINISHSNLMKSGMKSINKYLEDKGKKVHELTKKITDTNAWTLKIQDFNYENIIIHPGIPKKEKGDPKWDKNIQCNTKQSEEDNTSRAKLANLFKRK